MEQRFSSEQAAAVLDYIRQGKTPSQFCGTDYSLPLEASTIEMWAQSNERFAKDYTAAKCMGAEAMVEYCLLIADKPDIKADSKKIMIDTRMKIAALWHPEKYGPKVDKEASGNIMAHLHLPFDALSAEKRADVNKFFGLD